MGPCCYNNSRVILPGEPSDRYAPVLEHNSCNRQLKINVVDIQHHHYMRWCCEYDFPFFQIQLQAEHQVNQI